MLNRIKNNKTGLIIAAAVLALMLIVGLVFAANSSHIKLNKQLKLGNKYLSEANYDSAIASFDEAIAVDPMCVESYLGLIEAYQGKGDDETALEVAKKGFEATEDERLNGWIKQLEEKTKKVEAEKVEEPEEDFADGVIIPISELFNCPTICGVPWREAGGIEGMRALMPPLVAYDVSDDDEWVYYADNDSSVGDNQLYYSYSETETQKMIHNLSKTPEGESLFEFILQPNGTEYEIYNHYAYNSETSPFRGDDGFYSYMSKHGFTADEIVSGLGIDIGEFKDAPIAKNYMSDMGEMTVYYENLHGYYFDVHDSGQDFALVLGTYLNEYDDYDWKKRVYIGITKVD